MRELVLFDCHCDTPYELWRRQEKLDCNSCHVDLSRTERFSGYAQFFAFCTYAGLRSDYSSSELLWKPYDYFMDMLRECSDRTVLCKNALDMERSFSDRKSAVFLSLEGAEGIGCDPGRLEQLRMAGFTMVNLTWNDNNLLAGASARNGRGLTKQGKEFIRRAQELNMIIDVSHISERAFWDIMDITTKPVVASHSNSRVLCNHHRNLTDDQYRAICDCGGCVGINLYAPFLTNADRADYDDIYATIDHFFSLNSGHVALGGDLDGCNTLPVGFRGIEDYEKLASYLEDKGYSQQTLQNIYCNTIKEVVKLCTM